MRPVILLLLLQLFCNYAYCQLMSTTNRSADDAAQVRNIEVKWLGALHDKKVLEETLAGDFIHPVPAGIFLSKQQHIYWAVKNPSHDSIIRKFDTLFVRIYNKKTAIANGIVGTYNSKGKLLEKSIFTDVFIKKENRWQAVNAQENVVR